MTTARYDPSATSNGGPTDPFAGERSRDPNGPPNPRLPGGGRAARNRAAAASSGEYEAYQGQTERSGPSQRSGQYPPQPDGGAYGQTAGQTAGGATGQHGYRGGSAYGQNGYGRNGQNGYGANGAGTNGGGYGQGYNGRSSSGSGPASGRSGQGYGQPGGQPAGRSGQTYDRPASAYDRGGQTYDRSGQWSQPRQQGPPPTPPPAGLTATARPPATPPSNVQYSPTTLPPRPPTPPTPPGGAATQPGMSRASRPSGAYTGATLPGGQRSAPSATSTWQGQGRQTGQFPPAPAQGRHTQPGQHTQPGRQTQSGQWPTATATRSSPPPSAYGGANGGTAQALAAPPAPGATTLAPGPIPPRGAPSTIPPGWPPGSRDTQGMPPRPPYGTRVTPQRAARNGPPAQGRRAAGGAGGRPAYAGGVTAGGSRITPSRAQRHTRASVTTARNQVLQKRLIIAGCYAMAMVVCWFYIFPLLETVLPSEF